MTDTPEHRRPTADDDPAVTGHTSGNLDQGPDEPSIAWPTTDPAPAGHEEPPATPTTGDLDEPTLAAPVVAAREATAAPPPNEGDPTRAQPARGTEEPTLTAGGDETTTSAHEPTPTVRGQEPTPSAHGDEPTLTTGAHAPLHGDQPFLATGAHEATPATGGDEPTRTTSGPEPTHAVHGDQPALASGTHEPTPVVRGDEPTLTTGTQEPTLAVHSDETTLATSAYEPTPALHRDEPTLTTGTDEPTLAVGDDEATLPEAGDETTIADTTVEAGAGTGGGPLDLLEPPVEEVIWEAEAPPPAVSSTRSPAYYIALGAAVVLVVGLVALAAVVTVARPRQDVAGVAVAGAVPEITTTTPSQPPPPAPTSTAPAEGLAELAAHPLSSSPTRMANATCELPRFDPADDQQANFYAAAKVCADDAWRPLLDEAGLEGEVTVVTLTGPAQTQTCGELAPTSPSTQCDGVVYLTPAHLRDTEGNGRYPGRYLGVFLREYARALQFTNGIDELAAGATTAPTADLDTKLEQQATCLAGVAAGSMAGRGAIDSNITGEIRDRLSTVDAPADAEAWLDKGFQQRTPAACNAWAS